ncbi:PD40 domain-containing protein [Frankia sp. AgB1.9]|uniref:TolB family protein n=1 Tax=unclassified Frankia TaxID=2632575 RepID=UPI001933B914|nr:MULTISPECIES: PD40 domain-containing protein [unclassified Frankia]MBL7493344.1 PD40 domain-containing protein [Frankia sp. AgW1.1]MBL7549576.1 PD40 domain-containing protein [Frankia sp. AgB1.9]MBL7620444.1 PD40 domain-containing protein [Frankia sp. AgB1.8]
MEPRRLRPGQRSQLWVADTETGKQTLLYERHDLLFEAPNWVEPELMLVNADGKLWEYRFDGDLTPIAFEGVPDLNNDHIPDADGTHIYLSCNDWNIYRAPIRGGLAVPLTFSRNDPRTLYFAHGASPDGTQLSYIEAEVRANYEVTKTGIFMMSADGTNRRRLTPLENANGPEFTPDGEWVYYTTERFDGHMQIARMRPDATEDERVTFDEAADHWFPHFSPDGRRAAYLAYQRDSGDHPADRWVELRSVALPDWSSPRTMAQIRGGQGTLNVNSWSPDSTRFSYVAYPLPGDDADKVEP